MKNRRLIAAMLSASAGAMGLSTDAAHAQLNTATLSSITGVNLVGQPGQHAPNGYGADDINSCSIDLNNLISVGNFQYLAYYGAANGTSSNSTASVFLGRRAIPTTANPSPSWTVFNSGLTMAVGNSGSAGNALSDDHNVIALGVDNSGDLHMAFGMHNTPLNGSSDVGYYISAVGGATGTWSASALGLTKQTTLADGGVNETEVTYPNFYNQPGTNDLIFAYRQGGAGGGSGNGDEYFDDYTPGGSPAFTSTRVVDGMDTVPPGGVNAYLNSMVYTSTGTLLMSWTWRATPNWQTNSNIMFAQSSNNGVTWYQQGGSTQYTLPITQPPAGTSAQQSQVVWNLPQNTSFINQTSMTVDRNNNPIIATYWAPGTTGSTNAGLAVNATTNNPNRQYMLVYFDGTSWRTSQISDRVSDSSFDTGGGDVRDLGRPIVMVDNSGRVLVVTRSEDSSLGGFGANLGANKNNIVVYYNSTASLDSANPLPWLPIPLDSADMGQYEPTYDSALWAKSNILDLMYEPSGVGGSGASTPMQVLQWNEQSYFASNTPVSLLWDSNGAASGVLDGGGTWNTSGLNFSDDINNHAWINSTTQNVIFGANTAAAGTVALGANITVTNLTFDPAQSGNYTIATSGAFALTIASGGVITTNADATISAPIISAGLTKMGPGTLTLSGNNSSLTGTLSYGTATLIAGANAHGTVRITSTAAAGGLTQVNFFDNNGAYAFFQLDGSAGAITLPSTLNFTLAGTTGTNLTANTIENIAGSDTINGAISFNSGGSQYAVQSDAGTLTITSNLNLGNLSSRFLDLQGAGNGIWSGILSDHTSGAGQLEINKYGAGMWTLSNANTYTGATLVSAGTLAITGAIGSTSVTVNSGATLQAAGATNGGLPTTTALNVSGTAAFASGALNSGIGSRTLTSLTLNTGGLAQLLTPASHADRQVLVTSALNFGKVGSAWQGQLDLTANDAIIKGGNLTNIADQLKSGFNAQSGYWNGAGGILSSAAAGDTTFLTTIGYGAGGSPFDGVNTTSSDVLLKYTYYGDADLDGSVTGADYHQIDLGFGSHLTGWSNGDFNYDGVVNGADYALIDNTFNQINATSATPLELLASPTATTTGIGELSRAVPEPATLTLLALATCTAIFSRRRRTS